MERIYRSIAGLDVHQEEIVACILQEPIESRKVSKEIKRFGTTTEELRLLNQWVIDECVEAVVMESTGQYWRPVWNILNGYYEKILANPLEVKNLKGRKTDKRDAEHIADVTMHGLVRGSYVPDEETMDLRLLTRTRDNYKKEMTRHKNQIHNILQTANIKLTTYLKDIFGITGRKLIDLLIDGEVITLEKVHELRHSKVKASDEQLLSALDGQLNRTQRLVLIGLLHSLDYTQALIDDLESLIAEQHTSKHEELYQRLQEIPGVSDITAQVFLAEIGWNVDAFPTKEHISSWAGICPGSYESGGVKKSSHVTRGNKRLKGKLSQAASSASHSKDERFRSKYNSIRSRAGKLVANIAVAHQILTIMYLMTKYGTHYQEISQKKGLRNERNIS